MEMRKSDVNNFSQQVGLEYTADELREVMQFLIEEQYEVDWDKVEMILRFRCGYSSCGCGRVPGVDVCLNVNQDTTDEQRSWFKEKPKPKTERKNMFVAFLKKQEKK